MSDITALGQQLAKLISDCNKFAEYLYGIVTGLRQTSEVAQHMMQSTAQRNYLTMINNLSLAQISLSNAAADLVYAADTATNWLEMHIKGDSTGSPSSQMESITFPEPKENNTEKNPYKLLSEYEEAHSYEEDIFPPSYSNDPTWRVLYKATFPDAELPLIAQATAWTLLQKYMSSHNYGKKDADLYMQDPIWQELHKYAFPNLFSRPDSKESSQQHSSIIDALDQRNIEYHTIKLYGRERADEEIVARLGGGDKTDGSCSSLAFAYAGNKAGYDVLDFRGGDSRVIFSSDEYIKIIADLPTVDSYILNGKDEIECANQLLQNMIPEKEYYLATGRHAAIVKKQGEQFLYLELQSSYNNGWHLLNDDVLRDRFRCKRNFFIECPNFLIEIGSLSGCYEFLDILGYLNTAELDQMKGESGYER